MTRPMSIMSSSKSSWTTPFQIYWNAYGGIRKLLCSPYLIVSFVPFVALFDLWYFEGPDGIRTWPSYAISILPSLISFSLGSLAIVFAMSSGAYVKLLHKNGDPDSLFMRLVAVFFHFILVQVLALFATLGVFSKDNAFTSGLAFWLLCYALMSGIAAAANLVLIADIKNQASPLDD